MRKLFPIITIAVAVVALTVSSAAFGNGTTPNGNDGGTYWNGSEWQTSAHAFNVLFQQVSATPDNDGYWHYDWIVSIKPGAQANSNSGWSDITSIRGFAFDLPPVGSGGTGYVISDGVWIDDVLVTDKFNFVPHDNKNDGTFGGGEWELNGNVGTIGLDQYGEFRGGVAIQSGLAPWANGQPCDTQFHVGLLNGLTEFTNGPTVGLNGETFGGDTPELSTWALLACSLLAGVGFMKRRKA